MKTDLASLAQIVNGALAFFSEIPLPALDLNIFQLPFVVGSGNAINAGRIIFSGRPALFADESNYKQLLSSFKHVLDQGLIKQALVISSSGEKDSVWEVEYSRRMGLHCTLMTCKPESSAAKVADNVLVYRSISEPYTYNVSTYLGMILSATREQPKQIQNWLGSLKFPVRFNDYISYSFVLPDKYLELCPMLDVKKSELFGPHLSLRSFTEGHARHAKFVMPWDKELIIGIGSDCEYYGLKGHRWLIDVPEYVDYAAMLALTYFIIGKIQEAKPPYYLDNIVNYCRDYGPKAYGKPEKFELTVPGN